MIECPVCRTPNPQWLSVSLMANLLRVTPQEVRDRLRRGLIPDAEKTSRSKGEWAVPTQSFLRYYREVNGL